MPPQKENTLLGDATKQYLGSVSNKLTYGFFGAGLLWLGFAEAYAPIGRPQHEARLAAQQLHLDSLYTAQATSPDDLYQQSITYSGTRFTDRLTGFDYNGFHADTIQTSFTEAIADATQDHTELQDKLFLADKKDHQLALGGLAVLFIAGLAATSGRGAKKIARLFTTNDITRRELNDQIAHDQKRSAARHAARQRAMGFKS